jgi:pimeloyl-ACP methyl ester carboxylesterase
VNRAARRLLSALSAGAALFAAGSWLAARRLAPRLVSPAGLGPPPDRQRELLEALRRAAPIVEEFRHSGSPLDPVELAATFASPGDPGRRPTILFLHGKGGRACEWEDSALLALGLGYNALLPDLRGHGSSAGRYTTFGFLEKDDLANTIAGAQERWGVDTGRLGVHSCSAGSSIALDLAAHRPAVRAVWLESPFADAREMARHYLSVSTGIPAPLLSLATRWAVSRAVARVKRDLGLEHVPGGIENADPVAALRRVRCPVSLVYGDADRLVPPHFVERLVGALPPGSEVFRVRGAGHCHHPDEAAKVAQAEYRRRWIAFFESHLPVNAAGRAFADPPSGP